MNKKSENALNAADNAWTEPKAIPLIYRRMSDIQSEPIKWLWPYRIARGKITIIAGNPGLGKSQFTAYLAAVVTMGRYWPVSGDKCDSGSVAFICAEDDAADTIKPRLEAAGADLKCTYIIDAVPDKDKKERTLNLQDDISRINQFLESHQDIVLLVIDPITAYMGKVDSHKTADVRSVLAPLAEMAARHNVAIVCVSHLNKGSDTEAMMRVTGSLAYVAASRAAFLVAEDKENPTRRLLLHIKNNLSGDRTGLAFTIEPHHIVDCDIDTSKVVWENGYVHQTANDICAIPSSKEENSALSEAKDFLVDVLSNSPMGASEIKKQARDAGIKPRTLDRAKKELGIKAKKLGMEEGWAWVLPTKNANNSEERSP